MHRVKNCGLEFYLGSLAVLGTKTPTVPSRAQPLNVASGSALLASQKSQTETVKVEGLFSLIPYVPYIFGGAAIAIIALTVVYVTKIKKH